MDRKDGDGVEVWVTMNQEEMDYFERDADIVKFSSGYFERDVDHHHRTPLKINGFIQP